jgi:hypothetical protein
MKYIPASGMTLRDYFAAKAMQTLVDAYSISDYFPELSRLAYQMADAMLAQRKKK